MKELVLTLLTCSVTMSITALIYIAAASFNAKWFSAKSRYYIWLIVVVGLIIPFRPSFSRSLVEIRVPSEATISVVSPFQPDNSDLVADTVFTTDDGTASSAARDISWWVFAIIVWASGATIYLAYQLGRHIRFSATTKRWSEIVADGQAFELLQELKEEIGFKKPVGLYRCSCLGSPIGVLGNRIMLPHTNFDADDLRYILQHEMIHLKRRDLWFRALTLTATAIHWFNPIVHLMNGVINQLCEISCDEEIVRERDSDARLRYSETIIGVIRNQSRLNTALSTGFYSGKKGMKQRIAYIMDMRYRQAGVALLCAALLVTAGSGFAFAATAIEPIQTDYGVPAFESEVFLDVLQSNYRPDNQGNYVLHEPMQDQLSEAQAADAARRAAALIVKRLTDERMDFDAESMIVMAYLTQLRPLGQEQVPLDSKYSFWNVTLTVPDDFISYQTLIHAQTGTIWKSQISYLPIESGLALNVERVLSGFVSDLGYNGLVYDDNRSVTAGELGEDEVSAEGIIADGTVKTIASIIKMSDIIREGETTDNIERIGIYVTVSPMGEENAIADIVSR